MANEKCAVNGMRHASDLAERLIEAFFLITNFRGVIFREVSEPTTFYAGKKKVEWILMSSAICWNTFVLRLSIQLHLSAVCLVTFNK